MPHITSRMNLPSALNNQLPAFLSYFASGMAFVFFWNELFSRLAYLVLPCTAILVVCSAVSVPFATAFAVPFCLTVTVMFFAFTLKPFFSVGKNADFSYGMYLVHYPLVMCFTALGLFERFWIFALFAVLGTSFLCAYLLEIFHKKCMELWNSKEVRI